MAVQESGVLGQSVERLEDPPLITGQGRFAADINFPHQLHMRMVRSPHAHARIKSIDTSAALALPGVFAVWTADDIPEIGPVDFRADRAAEALKPYRQPVLATGRVRYVGDPVAAVFAEDNYLAEDAALLVEVEYEELPAIVTVDDPLGTFDDDGHGTEPAVIPHSYGDIDAAFTEAHAIVELELFTGRHAGIPMETRGAIGYYDAAKDILELHGAAKVLHRNKETLVRMLGRKPSGIHLHESHVGGGFGIRGEIYPEDVLVLAAAERFGRPVKWIEDRMEHLMCANQGREQHHWARMAIDAEGQILGIEDIFYHDQGGYIRTHGVVVPTLTMCLFTALYRVPAYRARGHVRLTNKTPCATYRAPGRYEASFVRERLMDAAAAKIGIDPIEFRRRNLITIAEIPYTISYDEPEAKGAEIDSGDYNLLLDKALAHVDWDTLSGELERRRAGGELVGAGIGIFLEEGGLGPTDGAKIAVDTAGDVEVVTGGASIGQGFETSMAQICAAALGVDYRCIRVIHGHTDRIPYGIGAHAQRTTVMTGNAVHATALAVRKKALDVASGILQTPAEELVITNGTVAQRGRTTGPSITLGEIAAQLAPASRSRGQHAPGLAAEEFFDTAETVFPYGVHIAVVRVDGGTGQVAVERFIIAYDVGRAVNPMLVEGQLVGGCVQGLGGALYEEFAYDERGQPLAVTFADYLMPTVSEVPNVEVLITEDAPSPNNPLGIKSAGEGGINAVGAAIAGAIDAAIGRPGAVTRLPVTPQRMKAILEDMKR
ncbi:MAG: xanthine dehydrogenase family protein molybdopterin-binding subunit [Alphaproteobacteria bacterium]|nr:xanthine dehydrogenase family protein molybdopterin-binding subunit [Alphaproteobacteria bacterium]